MLNKEVIDIIKSINNNFSLLIVVNTWMYGLDKNISNLRLHPLKENLFQYTLLRSINPDYDLLIVYYFITFHGLMLQNVYVYQ